MRKKMTNQHIAHIRKHDLMQHLKDTANQAQSAFSFSPAIAKWAYVAGLLHDLGKYSAEFQERIRKKSAGQPAKAVEHSTAGARKLIELYGERPGKIITYAITGHHAGLPNGKSKLAEDRSALDYRLDNKKHQIPDYNFYPPMLLDKIKDRLPLNATDLPFSLQRKDLGFGVAFFVRMLYSALVDADFLDTEKFMEPDKASLRGDFPALQDLWPRLEQRLAALSQKETEKNINRYRQEILQQCLNAAEGRVGLFSLTVPTGGGKTLSSLAFAIRHAIKYGLSRVIYVIPYTSIIEQNAQVFRGILGDNAVIEHHCNFDPTQADDDEQDGELKYLQAIENWDAPIIVTTNVQFFESLFACRSSRCRKLHNIMNSVVILDEAQMLPRDLLLPCLASLRELSSAYRASIVLCTATQPALSTSDKFKDGLDNVREIIAKPRDLYESLKRVNIRKLEGTITDEDLVQRLKQHEQVLCIVNTRGHARQLFELLRGTPGAYHLSALMCPAHRSQKIAEIKERLDKGLPCRVISTQLIEAGVDIDFPVVYRAMAGIDSIAQAAGRCNREGKFSRGEVFVFETDKIPTGQLRMAADVACSVLRRYPDVLTLDAVQDFFQSLFWQAGDKLDCKKILDKENYGMVKCDIAFRDIAEKFKLIEEEMQAVVVPWEEEGQRLVNDLKELARQYKYPAAAMLRKLQRYTVSIRQWSYQTLAKAGVVKVYCERYAVLTNPGVYHPDVGLCSEDPTFMEAESLVW
jgi:CRISPR-associated endonuclease/helicase Cas3